VATGKVKAIAAAAAEPWIIFEQKYSLVKDRVKFIKKHCEEFSVSIMKRNIMKITAQKLNSYLAFVSDDELPVV
jgi:hypothetical protein